MISDIIYENKIKFLKIKKQDAGREIMMWQNKLTKLGVKSKHINRPFSIVPESVVKEYHRCVDKIEGLRTLITELDKERMETHKERMSTKNMTVMRLFREIFSSEQMHKIYEEANRRQAGEDPLPMGLHYKDFERYKEGFYDYKQLAKEQIETMIQFRIMLTGLIERGCEKFGNAEFLKFISPINKLIIPVKELEQIKRKHLL